MAAAKVPRKRSANFTISEKSLLIDVVEKFRTVIENKQTDAITTDVKTRAWKDITALYNSLVTVARETPSLKACYDNLKKKAKKDAAEDKQSMFRTGGGPQESKIDEIGKKIISVMGQPFCYQVENAVDSDAVYVLTRADDSASHIEEASVSKSKVTEELDTSRSSCESVPLESAAIKNPVCSTITVMSPNKAKRRRPQLVKSSAGMLKEELISKISQSAESKRQYFNLMMEHENTEHEKRVRLMDAKLAFYTNHHSPNNDS